MAAVTPKIRVADPVYNAGVICERLEEAYAKGAKIIVFPELCITGYTCGDLFLQQLLLEGALAGLSEIQTATRGKDALVAVGLPIERVWIMLRPCCGRERFWGWFPRPISPPMRNFMRGGISRKAIESRSPLR